MKKLLLFLLTAILSMPLIMNAQFTATFGTGTDATTTGGSPGAPMSYGGAYSWTQQIYRAAEFTAANVPAGAIILSIEFYNATGATLMSDLRTYMGLCSNDYFSGTSAWVPYNTLTLVDSGDWNAPAGWFEIQLDQPYVWDGTSNLVVGVSFRGAHSDYSSNNPNCGYRYTAQGGSAHIRRFSTSLGSEDPTSTASGSVSPNRPNLRITYVVSGCASLTPTVANIGPYTADLNWMNFQQSVSSWDMMYGVQGTFDTLSGGSIITGITDTFYTLTGLTSATTYAVYMKPYCSSEIGTWSSPRIFTTTAACPTPTTPVVMSHTAEEATISWLPGASETGWEVACVPHGTPVGGATPDYVSSSPYTFTNLIDNTQYDVYVRADCGNGEYSYWTNAVTFTTDPYCTPPTNVSVDQIQATSALVTWSTAPVGAIGYTVGYSEAGMNNWTTQTVTGVNYMISGLTPNTEYDVFVYSECVQGNVDTIFSTFETGCMSGGDPFTEGTITTYYLPLNNFYNYSYTQQIYLASEMGGPATIDSIAFEYGYSSQTYDKTNVTIYLGHTTQSTFTSTSNYISSTGLQQVYSGPLNCQQGWNTFVFTSPFQYNGTDNLVLVVDDNSGGYDGSSYVFRAHNAGATRSVYYYSDSDNPSPSNPMSGSPNNSTSTNRSNVKFFIPCDNTISCAAPNVYVAETTPESVTLNWAPGTTETSWELEYSTDNVNWIPEGVVSVAPYMISNLTPNTLYTVRMRSVCGGGEYSNWAQLTARTACADMVTLPFMENFDSYTGATSTSVATNNLPNCWNYINEGTSTSYSGYPIIYNGSTYAHSGNNAMRFYTYITAGTYDDQIAILPPIDTDVNPMNTLQVSLQVRDNTTTYPFHLDVGIMTDPTDRNTFVTLQTITTSSTTYANYEIPFNQYTGTGKYIALRASQPTSGYNYGYVDDVRVELIPACPRPINVTSSAVTTNSITLGWTEVGSATSWVITYGPTGFTPGTPAAMTETVYDIPYTITGLSASTSYDFYVQADCGGGEYSNMSNVYTIATECDQITMLPYMENFDNMGSGSAIYPNCWLRHNNYSTSTNYPYVSTSYHASGNASLYFYSSSSTYNYAVLPPIDVTIYPINTLQVSFQMRSTSSATTSSIQVGVMTDSSNVNTFVPVQTVHNSTTGLFEPFEVPLTSYTGTGRFIALKLVNTSSTYSIYMDDLMVDIAPLCDKPTNVTASNITASSADINWMPGGNETSWEIVVVPSGMSVTSGTPETVSSHPYTLDNLTDNTAYDVYVHADCGTGVDFSSWSQVCSFSTTALCNPPTDVEVSQIAGTSALLTWTESVFGATGYTIAYTETGQNNWISQSVTGNNYMLTGLTPETPYTVTITSECTEGTAPVITRNFSTGCLFGGDNIVGNGTSTSYNIPLNTYYNYSYTQQLYLANEINNSGDIHSIGFQYIYSTAQTKNNQSIYLAETDLTSLSTWVPADSLTLVYSGSVNYNNSGPDNWVTINLTTPFTYSGTRNLVVVVKNDHGSYSTSNNNTFNTHSASNKTLQYYNDDDAFSFTSPDAASSYSYRNNIKFGMDCDNTVTCIAPNVYVSEVTGTSMTLNWAPGSYESSWELETSTDNATWNPEGTITTAPYTLSNLNPNTLYYVRMRSVCGGGDYSSWVALSQRTACSAIATLPYMENFDTYTGATTTSVAVNNLPNCWNYLNAGTSSSYSGYPIIYNSSSYAASGSNAMRFYTYITTGTYDDQIAILPEIDVNTLPINTLQLTFDARDNTTSYPFNLEIGVMTDPTDKNTFMLVSTITTSSTTYANYEIPLSQYNGTGAYIALKAPQPTSNYNYGYVDNVKLELIPSCPKPTQVHATNVSTNSVELGWVENGSATSWEIEYGPAGFTLGNGTVEPASTNPYTISNLSASTMYDFYVRSECGGNEYSNYSSVTTVATACDAISQLPYMDNFDSYGTGEGHFPNCWTKINTYSSDRPYVSSTHYAGVGSLYFYAGTSGTYNIAVTPPFDASIPVNTLQATFMHRAQYATDRLIVGVMTNPTDVSTFVPVDTILPATSPTAWQEVEVVFSQYSGTGQYIAFRNNYTSTSAYNYIDNLSIDLIPACPKPQNVHVTSVTTTTMELGWTEVGTATSWVIEYGPAGFTPGNGTVENAGTNPYTISGLTASTQYDFYVKSDCSGGEYSNYSSVLTAATACDAVDQLPYTENFDTYGTGESAYPNCWGKINTYSSNRPYVNTTHYAGVGSLYFYAGTSGTYNIAVTPPFDASIPISTLQATFMYRTTYSTDRLIVGVMTNPADASSFVPVDTVYPDASYTTWVEREVVFSQYTGAGQYIAFKNEYHTTYCYAYIDNLSINLIPSCPKPHNLHVVDATTNSIELGWTEVGSATSWEIVYGAPGFDPDGASATSVTATSNPYTVTGLNSSTTYEFYVRSNCSSTETSYWSTSMQGSTTMVPESLPYTADFSANDAWVFNNGSCTNYWMKGTVGGTAALFVTDNGSTPEYNGNSFSAVAALKLFTVGTADTITVSFDIMVDGEGSFDYFKLFLAPPSQQFPAATASSSDHFGYNSYSTNAYNFYANGYGTQSSYPYVLNKLTASIHVTAKILNPISNPNANSTALLALTWKNDGSVTYNPPATITNLSVTANGTAPVTCTTPTGLAVNNVTATTATASWTAGGTETSWNVQYKAASSSNWQSATANATSYTMTGLTPGTAYQVKVQANCGAGNVSAWTTPVSFNTPNETQTCPAPTNLTAVLGESHTTVILNWQQEPNTATEWQVNYRQTTENTWSTSIANATTYTLTDLEANVTYEFKVEAHCTNGLTSDASNSVTIQTDDVGVQSWLEKSVTLYPNPATEMIAVAVSDANIMITGVEVYNVYGQLINTIVSAENPLRINVSGLADGMYYVRVTTDNGVVTKNFVKR
ncbi:MAG: fibronectin type III domain-containing protein [Bacteroidales bacterium]|nr:fibronectin type III domain-containing protein [Bacteroidales bacterium]